MTQTPPVSTDIAFEIAAYVDRENLALEGLSTPAGHQQDWRVKRALVNLCLHLADWWAGPSTEQRREFRLRYAVHCWSFAAFAQPKVVVEQ